jgi:signal transduction histidine kinase
LKYRSKSGEAKYLTLESNSARNPDGSFKHTRCSLRDDLDRRIKEAIHEATIKHIKTALAAKDRFIRRVFHEIRTPMHAVLYGLGNDLSEPYLSELKNQVCYMYVHTS